MGNRSEETKLKYQETKQYLESVINASRDGILVANAKGRVEFANQASSMLLGRLESELIGAMLHTVIPSDSKGAFSRFWDAMVEGRPSRLTLELTGLDDALRTLIVSYKILETGASLKYFLDIRDMTARVRMERALRKERDRAQRYLQIAGVMIVAIDPTQKVVLANRRACEILGYPEEKILGVNWFDNFLPERERARVKVGFEALMRGELSSTEYFENPVMIRGGAERLIAWHNKLVYDEAGHIIGTISSGTDITDRKKAEQELLELNETLERRVIERTAVAEERAKKLHALTRELIQAESQERRRIALLLHEHFQQLLVAARMDLSRATNQSKSRALRDLLGDIDGNLREAIESSRTLAVELCPPVLYELGLVPALNWLGKRMHERHELEVLVDAELEQEPDDLDLRTFCYEAVRELLFNVVKHAHVHAARVSMRLQDDLLKVQVADEGVGFDPQEVRDEGVGSLDFGMFIIRERLSSFGGWIDVDTAPGKGTQVTFFAPLSHQTV